MLHICIHCRRTVEIDPADVRDSASSGGRGDAWRVGVTGAGEDELPGMVPEPRLFGAAVPNTVLFVEGWSARSAAQPPSHAADAHGFTKVTQRLDEAQQRRQRQQQMNALSDADAPFDLVPCCMPGVP